LVYQALYYAQRIDPRRWSL